VRDQIVDFVRCWSEKTEIGAGRFIEWLGIRASKFYDWRDRYGKANEHNAWVPRDFSLEEWEKKAIVDFHANNPLEGYRRLTFMMLDQDISSRNRGVRFDGVKGIVQWRASERNTARGTVRIEIHDATVEARIHRQMRATGAANAEEALLHLLDTQEEQDRWLMDNRDAINAKIRRGITQLDRGEGIPEDELDAYLTEQKAKPE
jgi:hypothetical protein